MRAYVRFIVPMLVVTMAVAVACGGGGSKTVNVPGGGQVSVSDKLPSSFPSDFPTYNGAKVTTSYSGKSQGISGTVVLWQTGDSVDKVKSFFDDRLSQGAWKSTSNGDISGSAYWGGENKDGTKVFYAGATAADGKTTITVTIGDKSNGSSSSGSSSSGSSKTSTSSSSDSSDSADATPEPTVAAKLPPEVKISKDFPADRVPFPSGARVTSSSSFGGGGSKTYSVEIYVKDTPEKVGTYFSDELPKRGWKSAYSSQSNGDYVETFSNEAAGATTTENVTISATASDVSGYTTATILVTSSGG